MKITKYDIITEAMAVTGTRHEDDKVRLERLLNKILSSLSERHSWELLRRRVEVDLSESETTTGQEGVWLPGNLAGIDAVQDVSTGVYYVRRERDQIANVEYPMPRYSVYAPGLPPLFATDDMSITRGGNKVVSPYLSAINDNYSGEWCRLGNEPQSYLLSDNTTLSELYWGKTITNGSFVVRPSSQRKLVVMDDHDQIKVSGTVIVYYWIYHPCMFRDSDELMLPNPRLVDLMMQKEAKGSLGRRARDPLNSEIDQEWKVSVRLNPAYNVPASPLDRIGSNFNPASLQWSSRDKKTRSYDVSLWRPLE
jgi:hypothetical protein